MTFRRCAIALAQCTVAVLTTETLAKQNFCLDVSVSLACQAQWAAQHVWRGYLAYRAHCVDSTYLHCVLVSGGFEFPRSVLLQCW
jgi:hypothetical protein